MKTFAEKTVDFRTDVKRTHSGKKRLYGIYKNPGAGILGYILLNVVSGRSRH